jgi:hypothetical protein
MRHRPIKLEDNKATEKTPQMYGYDYFGLTRGRGKTFGKPSALFWPVSIVVFPNMTIAPDSTRQPCQ